MKKRGVGITLDIDVVDAIKNLQKDSRGTKFSSIVNCLLREHSEVKKRLKKGEKKNGKK